ncbi:hypothetical protein QYM36_017423 [Artemia franciscana]|uniref:Uncharacterized protein n=1 Tax=Artemia franciscana TaxID=6661 RepID=A0AA88HAR8_ARTSF|nr:hypothetical protein QYM36_017423 [Artemia franciscana]
MLQLSRDLNFGELRISIRVGLNCKFIPTHCITAKLRTSKCKALPMFHAFLGCDITASFANFGRALGWKLWHIYRETSLSMTSATEYDKLIDKNVVVEPERFLNLLYDRTICNADINEACKSLFCQGKSVDRIPPTREATFQHIRHAIFQAKI